MRHPQVLLLVGEKQTKLNTFCEGKSRSRADFNPVQNMPWLTTIHAYIFTNFIVYISRCLTLKEFFWESVDLLYFADPNNFTVLQALPQKCTEWIGLWASKIFQPPAKELQKSFHTRAGSLVAAVNSSALTRCGQGSLLLWEREGNHNSSDVAFLLRSVFAFTNGKPLCKVLSKVHVTREPSLPLTHVPTTPLCGEWQTLTMNYVVDFFTNRETSLYKPHNKQTNKEYKAEYGQFDQLTFKLWVP